MKLRVIIVEDERHARDSLRRILEQGHSDMEIVGEAATIKEGSRLLERGSIDGVFLDIHFQRKGEEPGLELAYRINAMTPAPWVVFTTAHAQHALKTYHLHPADYLLKPLGNAEVTNALNWVRQHYGTPQVDRSLPIAIRHRITDQYGERHWPIDYVSPKAEISYIRTGDDGGETVRVHLADCKKPIGVAGPPMRGEERCKNLIGVAGPLKIWEGRLRSYGFLRIHRSVLLNPYCLCSRRPHLFRREVYEVLLRCCHDRLPVGQNGLINLPGR